MSNSQDLFIAEEPDPSIKLVRELNDQNNLWSFSHLPHYGLLSPNPCALMIPATALACFNPNAVDPSRMIKENDIINVTSDPSHRVYQAWNPPPDYAIEAGFQRAFRVRYVTTDSLNHPIIIADEAL